MSVRSINKTIGLNILPFTATGAEKSPVESQVSNTKKDSKALLYTTLASLATIGIAGALYSIKRMKKPTFTKFKEMGFRCEDEFIIDKNGQVYTGEIFGRYKGGEKIIRYRDGKKCYVVLRPKNSEYIEIKKIYDYEKFEVSTKKIKTDGTEEKTVRNINNKKLEKMIDEIVEMIGNEK